MSQPEFMTGQELWDKSDALYTAHSPGARRHALSEMSDVTQKVWHALAAELKVPRPKVPTLEEVYELWEDNFEPEDRATEEELEILRQRLNAAHEAKERRA